MNSRAEEAQSDEKSEEEINKQAIKAIKSVYFVSYYIDLETKKFNVISSNENADKLLGNCNNLEEGLTLFLDNLVGSEYKEKVKEFCDLRTVPERLKGKSHIDCEYLSKVSTGWCEASFVPVESDSQSEIKHVLFVIANLNHDRIRRIEEEYESEKNIKKLFDNVPGGIVLFEWDGNDLKPIYVSKYYYKYYDLSDKNSAQSKLNFKFVHPEDVEAYRNAIYESLKKSHRFEHVFRVYSEAKKDYIWIKIDAASKKEPNGKAYVYAMYSDVTAQEEMKNTLEKNHKFLVDALSASKLIGYEYDPVEHNVYCFSDKNDLNIPRRIQNFPDSIKNMDIIHKDDLEKFISTAHKMDDGPKKAQCDVRFKKNNEYVWYSCVFYPFFNQVKGREVAILIADDISLRVNAVNKYERDLKVLISSSESTLSSCLVNITKNTFEQVKISSYEYTLDKNASTFEEYVMSAKANMANEKNKEEFTRIFNRENLLSLAREGETHVRYEYLAKLNSRHSEWITACVDMTQNPITGEVIGALYGKSSHLSHISKILLDKTLEQDYIFAAAVFTDTDDFYLYHSENKGYSGRSSDFWNVALHDVNSRCDESVSKTLKEVFNKEKIIDILSKQGEYVFSYDHSINGKMNRLEFKFTYLDEEKSMLLVSIRNITDESLLQKFKFDSEHDSLTGLYNRKKFMEEARATLKAHKDESFAVVHLDVKNFHRYNSFFGEEKGDELLCDLADMLRFINKDYPYSVYGRIEADTFAELVPFDKMKCLRHISEGMQITQKKYKDFLVRPRVGIYLINDKNVPVELMYSKAAMAAKRIQSNDTETLAVYDEEIEQKLFEEQQVVNDMPEAIEKEQFKVYLQGKYSLRTGKPIGAEALVRWIHPVKGIIPPYKFIGVYETNGFIVDLDRYMWEHVCMILSRWKREGREILPISVNMSRVSLFNTSTTSFLKSLIEKYGIEPKYLELELTESAYVENTDFIRPQLIALQKMGFKILMDDFGSGYSSLSTLKDLPVDVLKLDMKLLSSNNDNEMGNLVISSIIHMSKMLHLSVVAEGVEETSQAEFLRSVGCEYVQGYLYAKPQPVEEYEQFVLSNRSDGAPDDVPDSEMSVKSLSKLISNEESLGEHFPIPVALVEYSKGTFIYLRTNFLFMEEFGLVDDLSKASSIFKNNLHDEEYDLLLSKYGECAKEKKNVRFVMTWGKENHRKRYGVSLSYKGSIGDYSLAIASYTDLSPFE